MGKLNGNIMKFKLTYHILFLLLVLSLGCETKKSVAKSIQEQQAKVMVDTLRRDTIVLKESFNEVDPIENEYLTEKLNPIRANFKRINSITDWTNIGKKDLWETTEGGEATFYYIKERLEKI